MKICLSFYFIIHSEASRNNKQKSKLRTATNKSDYWWSACLLAIYLSTEGGAGGPGKELCHFWALSPLTDTEETKLSGEKLENEISRYILKEHFHISASWWRLTSSLGDGRGAVVQGADLLLQGPQVLLVGGLVGSEHLLHLPQGLDQLVGGRTLLLNGSLRMPGRVCNMLFILEIKKRWYSTTHLKVLLWFKLLCCINEVRESFCFSVLLPNYPKLFVGHSWANLGIKVLLQRRVKMIKDFVREKTPIIVDVLIMDYWGIILCSRDFDVGHNWASTEHKSKIK